MDSAPHTLLEEAQPSRRPLSPLVVPLDQVDLGAIAMVGGKNASLGEMISGLAAAGVRVPGGGLPPPRRPITCCCTTINFRRGLSFC